MSDTPPAETRAERAEAAATRRRWISLAEAVAVAGVLIGAITLFLNWSDRRAETADKVTASKIEAQAKAKVVLTGTASDDGRVLKLSDAAHDLQEATVAFPRPLGVPIQRTTAEPAIDSRGFTDVLLKLTDKGPDERAGRVPALVTVRYLVDGSPRSHSAIYDVIWRTEGRMLQGRTLRLEALRLREPGGNQARVDALWKRDGFN
jgi:hypothetical protein